MLADRQRERVLALPADIAKDDMRAQTACAVTGDVENEEFWPSANPAGTFESTSRCIIILFIHIRLAGNLETAF